jgi:hypothetical protein
VRSDSGAAASSKRVCGCGGSSSAPYAVCEEDEEALKYAAEAEEEGLRTRGSSAGDTDLNAQFFFTNFFLPIFFVIKNWEGKKKLVRKKSTKKLDYEKKNLWRMCVCILLYACPRTGFSYAAVYCVSCIYVHMYAYMYMYACMHVCIYIYIKC